MGNTSVVHSGIWLVAAIAAASPAIADPARSARAAPAPAPAHEAAIDLAIAAIDRAPARVAVAVAQEADSANLVAQQADREQPLADAPAVAAPCSWAASASATTEPERSAAAIDDPALPMRWIAELGLRFAQPVIDGVTNGGNVEALAGVGVQLDRFSLLAIYGVGLIHHDASTDSQGRASAGTGLADLDVSTDGVIHQLGGEARYAFFATRPTSPIGRPYHHGGFEMFASAGAGAEIIQWDLGGRLVRPELSAGVGMIGSFRSSSHRRTGWMLELKGQVARRIDVDGEPATCAAPCTEPTPPVAWRDRSLMLESGFTFGD